MSEFSELFLELRTILDDPEAYYEQIGEQLDPELVDQLRAYAASHNIPLQDALFGALQLFMLTSAEEAWRKLSLEVGGEDADSAAPLTVVLERFLTVALDPSRQKRIEGPDLRASLHAFRRLRE